MARPERRDVDYFPFFVKRGKTLNILQSKYGLEGIGFFTNLMRFLSLTPDHHCCIEDECERMNFFAEIGMQDESKGIEMIELMVKTEKLDKDLWENHKVIVCPVFILSIEDAYERRSNNIITIEAIRAKFQNPSSGVIVPENTENTDVSGVIVPENDTETPQTDQKYDNNPQSKVKKSKVKESKVNSEKVIDPQKNLPEHFLHRWQKTPDVFNCLARLKRPLDWQAFWEQSTMTLKEIDLALDNYIQGVRTGAIERKYIPSSPDGFVLNGHLARSIDPYKKSGQRIANDNVRANDVSKYFSRTRRGLKK